MDGAILADTIVLNSVRIYQLLLSTDLFLPDTKAAKKIFNSSKSLMRELSFYRKLWLGQNLTVPGKAFSCSKCHHRYYRQVSSLVVCLMIL